MKKGKKFDSRARISICRYEQLDGIHYDEYGTSYPVLNYISVRVIFSLLVMATLWDELINIKGAFLNKCFQNGE